MALHKKFRSRNCMVRGCVRIAQRHYLSLSCELVDATAKSKILGAEQIENFTKLIPKILFTLTSSDCLGWEYIGEHIVEKNSSSYLREELIMFIILGWDIEGKLAHNSLLGLKIVFLIVKYIFPFSFPFFSLL